MENILEKLQRWVRESHKIELQLKKLQCSDKIIRIQTAISNAEQSRMSAGDMARIFMLGAEARDSSVRWIPKNNNCTFDGELGEYESEIETINSLKKQIRALLYEAIDDWAHKRFMAEGSAFSSDEFWFYLDRFKIALYDTDRTLGLRLGDIYASKS